MHSVGVRSSVRQGHGVLSRFGVPRIRWDRWGVLMYLGVVDRG